MGSVAQFVQVRRRATGDGSPTLVRSDGLSYRSMHGARTEARHVFVAGAGLDVGEAPRRVVEFGFGAGTNFAATVIARRARGPLTYVGVDLAPVAPEDLPCFDAVAHALATAATTSGRAAQQEVALELRRVHFDDIVPTKPFDAVFFDPFGPADEPDSWSVPCLLAARACLAPHGRLVSYAVAGWVRRNMAAAGLYVATPPGPEGKRQFTLATPTPAQLAGHKIRNRPP